MDLLTLNPGSSSLKAAAFTLTPSHGEGECSIRQQAKQSLKGVGADGGSSWEEAVNTVLSRLREAGGATEPGVVALRVVQGGPAVRRSAVIDAAVRRELEAARERAPLHNGPALEVLDAAQAALPGACFVAVLDTELFEDLPEVERALPLPPEVIERHGLRRSGFHGLAHQSLLESFARTGRLGEETPVISLQLGSGCSVAGFRGRQPLCQSMGFSPLAGPMMNTRSGSFDPALALFLLEHEPELASPAELEAWLNTACGLQGVSGLEGGMEAIEAERATGHERAARAFDLFIHRLRQHLGQALASTGPPEALLFGGGVGEHSPAVRAAICEAFPWLGLQLDPARNANPPGDGRLHADRSAVGIYRYAVDEERLLAEKAAAVAEATHPPSQNAEDTH